MPRWIHAQLTDAIRTFRTSRRFPNCWTSEVVVLYLFLPCILLAHNGDSISGPAKLSAEGECRFGRFRTEIQTRKLSDRNLYLEPSRFLVEKLKLEAFQLTRTLSLWNQKLSNIQRLGTFNPKARVLNIFWFRFFKQTCCEPFTTMDHLWSRLFGSKLSMPLRCRERQKSPSLKIRLYDLSGHKIERDWLIIPNHSEKV